MDPKSIEHLKSEPAFPSHGSIGEVAQQGMTLRDYFAAKAMLGFVASELPNRRYEDAHAVADASYKLADAMLLARSE